MQGDAFHHRKAHADAHGNVGKRCILQLTDEEKQQKQNQLQPFLDGRADVEHSRHGVIAHQLRQKAADGACEKRDQHAAKNSRQQPPRLSFEQEYSQQPAPLMQASNRSDRMTSLSLLAGRHCGVGKKNHHQQLKSVIDRSLRQKDAQSQKTIISAHAGTESRFRLSLSVKAS